MESYIRHNEDQNFWNFLFSIFFAVLLVLALWHFYQIYGTYPQGITVFDAALIALAIMRITRLVVYDKITRFAREWFLLKRELEGDRVEMRQPRKGFRHTVYDLMQCPWCVGVWVSLVVVYSYYMFAWAWFIIFVLAIAGLGSLLQIIGNLIGWKAELKKMEAQEKGGGR